VSFSRERSILTKQQQSQYRGKGINKKTVDNNPLVFKFEYGAANKGYWNCEHMILQLDDCIDA